LVAAFFYLKLSEESAIPDPVLSETTVAAGPVRIAVLPLENRSEDAEQAYFSKTMTEEIWNQLARIEGLKLISMRSSAVLANAQLDVREIGRQLTARYIIDVSVNRTNSHGGWPSEPTIRGCHLQS